MTKNYTAAGRWDELQLERSLYLDQAIASSSLTIPSLIPQSDLTAGKSKSNSLPSLYQGAGARGVNGLAAKLLLALYPAQQPFFRLALEPEKLSKYLEQQGADTPEIRSQIEEKLSGFERAILRKLDALKTRTSLFEAIKHLIVGGNGLLYIGSESIRFYSLRSFAVRRDPEGNVTEAVIKEELAEEYLPASVMSDKGDSEDYKDALCDVFTHIEYDPKIDKIQWYQEFEGKKIPGTAGFSTMLQSPWIFLRLTRIAGESYGRGLVEEVIGDLQTLESLSKAIVQGNLINAKTIFLCNPNGVTRADVLSNAENGDVVPGNVEDVQPLESNKSRDFAVALQTVQMIERRLQFVFMATESLQRDAERVTAEEIRLMAEQLEQGLGGIYSILSEELQLPLIKRVVGLMERDGEIQKLPKEFVQPHVTTGLDAIGRGNDRARLTQFLGTIAQAIGPEQFLQYIKPAELIRRFAAADGIDAKGLVKTEQELQDEMAEAQKVQLQQTIAANSLRNGTGTTAAGQAPQPPSPTGNGSAGVPTAGSAAG